MSSVVPILDDFSHRDAKALIDHHNLAARDEAVVDIDVDRFADLAVQFKHRAAREAQQRGNVDIGLAEHCLDVNRDVEDRRKICRRLDRIVFGGDVVDEEIF